MQTIRRTDTRYDLPVLIASDAGKCDQYRLLESCEVELFDGRPVVLPAGFVSDCHSTPPWSQSLLPAYDARTALAAIVHDYLYMHWETFTAEAFRGQYEWPYQPGRRYVDYAYFELMERFVPGYWRNAVYHAGVRLFGWWNWRKFRKAHD